jgi:hypothetical protein
MKFLVIQRFKDSFYVLPQEKQAEIMIGAFTFADKYIKTGGCKMVYVFSDAKGNASIWDVESSEDWLHIGLEYPLSPYVDMERIPVVDYDDASKIMKESMAATRKSTPQKIPALSR